MLVKMLVKRMSLYSLLIEVLTDAAAMGISMEDPQRNSKAELPYGPTLLSQSQGTASVFISALLTITKIRNPSQWPLADERLKGCSSEMWNEIMAFKEEGETED